MHSADRPVVEVNDLFAAVRRADSQETVVCPPRPPGCFGLARVPPSLTTFQDQRHGALVLYLHERVIYDFTEGELFGIETDRTVSVMATQARIRLGDREQSPVDIDGEVTSVLGHAPNAHLLRAAEVATHDLCRALPATEYEISRWMYGRRVGRNGHVAWARNYYSAPYPHVGTKVDLRITDTMLEVYLGQQRLASHLLLPETVVNEYRTNDADLPAGPKYRQWDQPRTREWAERVGPSAVIVVDRIFESVPVAEQGLNAALAVLRLTRRYSAERVEAACRIALAGPIRSPRYAHLRPILETGQDKPALPTGRASGQQLAEETGGYVRGADYYAAGGAR